MAILNLYETSGLRQISSAPGSPESKEAAKRLVNDFCGRLVLHQGKLALSIPAVDPDLGITVACTDADLRSILSVLGLGDVPVIRPNEPSFAVAKPHHN